MTNIVVLIKQVPDTWSERKLKDDDYTLDRDAADAVLDEINERAVEEALLIKEKEAADGTESTVTVLTAGPGRATEAIRKALSMGAAKAVHLVDDGLAGSDALSTSYALGQHRGHHAHPGISRLRPADHQVKAGLPEYLGQRVRGGPRVGPGQPVIQQVHRLVRAHRQRLADRLGRLVRAHGHDGDLGLGARLALGLGDLQALLDGVLVELVDEPVHRRAVQRAVRVRELAFDSSIRHLLDQHGDIHRLHRPFHV